MVKSHADARLLLSPGLKDARQFGQPNAVAPIILDAQTGTARDE